MNPQSRIDQALTLVVVLGLIVGCFLVLRPFMTALLWASILAVTTWPMFVRLRDAMHGRGGWASLVMVLAFAMVLVAPFVIVGTTIVDNMDRIGTVVREFIARGPPAPPDWLRSIPLVGERMSAYWGTFAHDTTGLLEELARLAEPLRNTLITGGASLLTGLGQLGLALLLVFFFFRDGDSIYGQVSAAVRRIAPLNGERLLVVAGATTRGVVLGILGTALVQGILMALGAWMAGMKAAPLLGFLVFLLSPIPVGPPLIWGSAAFTLFAYDQNGWAIFMIIWGFGVVSTVDNVLRPLIISQGSEMPFVLVLLGVLGGVFAFGVIGLFIGPVLLAVGQRLFREWASYKAETPLPPIDTTAEAPSADASSDEFFR